MTGVAAAVAPPTSPLDPFTEMALSRLSKALGPRKAEAILLSILASMQIPSLATAQNLCDFANYLVGYGGVCEAVARSLKVVALLRSATDRPLPSGAR